MIAHVICKIEGLREQAKDGKLRATIVTRTTVVKRHRGGQSFLQVRLGLLYGKLRQPRREEEDSSDAPTPGLMRKQCIRTYLEKEKST